MSQGAAGTEFVPRKGSTGDLALQQLRANGRMTRAALALAIDKSPDEIRALLKYPIDLGAIRVGGDVGEMWFEVGDRFVKLPPEPAKPAVVRPVAGKPVKLELDALAGLGDEVLEKCHPDVQKVVANERISNVQWSAAANEDVKAAVASALEIPTFVRKPKKIQALPAGPAGDGSQKPDGVGGDCHARAGSETHPKGANRGVPTGQSHDAGRVQERQGRGNNVASVPAAAPASIPSRAGVGVGGTGSAPRCAMWDDFSFHLRRDDGSLLILTPSEFGAIVRYCDGVYLDPLREEAAA
jgi:hypothetical protein